MAYSGWLERSPVLSRCISTGNPGLITGFIVGGGELLCQTIFENRSPFSVGENSKPLDYQRLLRSYIIGFSVISPNLYVWYNKILPRLMSAGPWGNSSPLVKTFVGTAFDQTIFATVILTQFFFFSKLLEVHLVL